MPLKSGNLLRLLQANALVLVYRFCGLYLSSACLLVELYSKNLSSAEQKSSPRRSYVPSPARHEANQPGGGTCAGGRRPGRGDVGA